MHCRHGDAYGYPSSPCQKMKRCSQNYFSTSSRKGPEPGAQLRKSFFHSRAATSLTRGLRSPCVCLRKSLTTRGAYLSRYGREYAELEALMRDGGRFAGRNYITTSREQPEELFPGSQSPEPTSTQTLEAMAQG